MLNNLIEVVASSPDQMRAIGEKLGRQLRAGDVIELRGDLGAGKTTFTQGIGRSLGISEITSPTFTISKIYNSTPKLIHIDLYRMQGSGYSLFDDLDIDSYLPLSALVIEWGENFTHRISDQYLLIEITTLPNEDRKLIFSGTNERWASLKL
jgi:tRNA threonylcarbamoyladenosine biosynthesis protein TsaE